jgi:hypothetical protein
MMTGLPCTLKTWETMSDPEVVNYIRQCRAGGFSDAQILAELQKAGASPDSINEAFAEIDRPQVPLEQTEISAPQFGVSEEFGSQAVPAEEAQAPKKPFWKKALLGLAVLGVLGGAGALKLGLFKPKPTGERAEIKAKLDAYQPERWGGHPHLPEFLPEQGPGNAGEDYRLALAEIITKDFNCGDPIDELLFKEAIGHLEAAVAKKESLIVGNVVPFPDSRAAYMTAFGTMMKLSCFGRVFVNRSRRLHKEGDRQGSIEEAKKQVAMAYHLSLEWHAPLHLMSLGMLSEGTLRISAASPGKEYVEYRLRLAFSGKDVLANTLDVVEFKRIRKYAQYPSQLAELEKHLNEPNGRSMYASWALIQVAANWSEKEVDAATADPRRRDFLSKAAAHSHPIVAKLATADLGVLGSIEREYRGVSLTERRKKDEKLKDIWNSF